MAYDAMTRRSELIAIDIPNHVAPTSYVAGLMSRLSPTCGLPQTICT
jgi:hypothetical protein